MIEWTEVAQDREGLRIHRIDSAASGIPGSGAGGVRSNFAAGGAASR
jgi:hypothetical protein